MNPYKKLTPFKWFCMQNFPFIEEDFDAITEYQLLCKIVEYLNKTIDKTNELGVKVEELNNWFNNLDVQDEIDNKLNEMTEDGTLAEIINEEIFSELNTKINNMENILNNESKIHFIANTSLEAEQSNFLGDCTLITGEKNILIDIGNQTTAGTLLTYLENNNINKLDYIIISHYHNDHIGGNNAEGFLALINSGIDLSECTVILPHKGINYSRFIPSSSENIYQIREQIIMTNLSANDIAYAFAEEGEVIEINSNEQLEFYNADLNYYSDYYNYTIDSMGNDTEYTNYNNFSLITLYKHFNNCVALTGDIEELAEQKNYSCFKNVNLLKLEHHGLNVRSNNNYLSNLNPKIAVVCNSQYYNYVEDYAHPTVFDVTSKGAKLYTTRNSGKTIVFTSKYNGIEELDNTNTKLQNMQYDLYAGQDIYLNDDLNDYIKPRHI